MRRFGSPFLIAAVLLAGCSSASVAVPDASAAQEASQDTAETADTAEQESSQEAGEQAAETDAEQDAVTRAAGSDETPEETSAPLEAYDPNDVPAATETNASTAWISRRSMTAVSIEVVWSEIEGAVDYQIHRLGRTGTATPDESEMTTENLVHSTETSGAFLDTSVVANELYWYGVRGLDAQGEVLLVGWHDTAAVTDEQPPEQVALQAEFSNGSVFLTWEEPEENFQLHSYRILRAVGSEEPEVVGATWNLDQRSFVDNDPPQELATYSVVAFDFHWNDSLPAEVTIDPSS